uniref:hypothetical protein n=1 Tax=Streptomyces sp. f51 TaxID=1827742 RepID=UPI0027BA5110
GLGRLGPDPLGGGRGLRAHPVGALLRLGLEPLRLGGRLAPQPYGDVLALGPGLGGVRRGLVAQPLGLRLGLLGQRALPLGGLRAQPLRLLVRLAADPLGLGTGLAQRLLGGRELRLGLGVQPGQLVGGLGLPGGDAALGLLAQLGSCLLYTS